MIVCILQVKRIMNTVFYMLRNEFEADDSYTGSEIMKVVLQTIKVHTNLQVRIIMFKNIAMYRRANWWHL